jgi:hypothetical protein
MAQATIVRLVLEDDEAKYLSDILQMWIAGIEESIPDLATQADIDVPWQRFQLRKQLLVAQAIQLRLELERGKDGGGR